MLHLKRYDFFELNLLSNSRREIERHNLAVAIRAIIQFVAVKDVDGFLGKQGSLMPGVTRLSAFVALFAFFPLLTFGDIVGGWRFAGIGGVL